MLSLWKTINFNLILENHIIVCKMEPKEIVAEASDLSEEAIILENGKLLLVSTINGSF